jgi:hypothetical protein
VVVEVVVGTVGRPVVEVVLEGFNTSCEGVIDTSWKTPFTALNTTTIAGALRDVPVAQSGWQLFTFNVPLPCPPVAAPHNVQLMAVTVVPPVAHPTVSFVGRTWGVDTGPQDSTAGTGAAVVVVVEGGVLEVLPCAVGVDPPLSVDLVVGEELEPTTKPTTIPIPRAERTSATMPTRM